MPLQTSSRQDSNTSLYLPDDILIMIFSKLDAKSLLNCMLVNERWLRIVEYCCQHFNLWKEIIEEIISNSALKLKEKSTLELNHLYTCIQQWLKAKNATVSYRHNYKAKYVKDICIFEDNFIVITNNAVNYYNTNKFTLVKTVPTKCLKYEENKAFSAEVAIPVGRQDEGNLLVLINKLHKTDCVCTKGKRMILCRILLLKVHLNTCYVVDSMNAIRAFKADYCKWQETVLARYYGIINSILDINIHKDDIYVLLRRGDVLYLNVQSKKLDKIHHFETCLHNMILKPLLTFHSISQIFSVSHDENMHIYPQPNDQIVMACPGATCAMEHGPVLIISYDDMKINVHLIEKLRKNILEPELRIDLSSYLEASQLNGKIKALDVHEGKLGHHLFVATDTAVHELLISEIF